MNRYYYVYIMTNQTNTVLYTGVTNNLTRRVFEHKTRTAKSFTRRYRIDKLVYFETFEDPSSAIEREKQIKAGSRRKKLELIKKTNPERRDLFEEVEEVSM